MKKHKAILILLCMLISMGAMAQEDGKTMYSRYRNSASETKVLKMMTEEIERAGLTNKIFSQNETDNREALDWLIKHGYNYPEGLNLTPAYRLKNYMIDKILKSEGNRTNWLTIKILAQGTQENIEIPKDRTYKIIIEVSKECEIPDVFISDKKKTTIWSNEDKESLMISLPLAETSKGYALTLKNPYKTDIKYSIHYISTQPQ